MTKRLFPISLILVLAIAGCSTRYSALKSSSFPNPPQVPLRIYVSIGGPLGYSIKDELSCQKIRLMKQNDDGDIVPVGVVDNPYELVNCKCKADLVLSISTEDLGWTGDHKRIAISEPDWRPISDPDVKVRYIDDGEFYSMGYSLLLSEVKSKKELVRTSILISEVPESEAMKYYTDEQYRVRFYRAARESSEDPSDRYSTTYEPHEWKGKTINRKGIPGSIEDMVVMLIMNDICGTERKFTSKKWIRL